MIMTVVRKVVAAVRGGQSAPVVAKVEPVTATPTAEDFAKFRREIDAGEGAARGLHGNTRSDALRGLDAMVTRCPHVLVLIAERGDVASLIVYGRERV